MSLPRHEPTAKQSADLTPRWRDRRVARRRLRQVASVLAREYGTPDLGNQLDPLDEAAYIIITHQTDIPRARQVWSAVRKRFPYWNDVMRAPEDELAAVLRPAGLHLARARLLRSMIAEVIRSVGTASLDHIRSLKTPEAEAFLRSLPGLDRKSARCVLLYSLGRAVFPVDSNTFRFAMRYGIVRENARYRRATLHDALQDLVPVKLRHDFHVNLVVHGQRTCLPRGPRCPACPLQRSCATGIAVMAAAERTRPYVNH